MGKIMLDTSFPNNPAWLEPGGANAMALHLGALAYSDNHGLDGIIPDKLVPHVSLAVSPGDVPSALQILLDFGFWAKMSRDKYAIQEYERTNFTKAQADEFREREANKKRRQRLHSAGDHSLCTSAKWCPAVKEREQLSQGDTRGTRPSTAKRDTRGSIPSPYKSIRPQGSMDVMDGDVGPAGPDSAGATSSPRPGRDEKLVDPEASWERPTYAHPKGEPPKPVIIDGVRHKPRLHPDGTWISAGWLGFGPWDVEEWAFIAAVQARREELGVGNTDPADTLAGLIPSGTVSPAGGAAR